MVSGPLCRPSGLPWCGYGNPTIETPGLRDWGGLDYSGRKPMLEREISVSLPCLIAWGAWLTATGLGAVAVATETWAVALVSLFVLGAAVTLSVRRYVMCLDQEIRAAFDIAHQRQREDVRSIR